MADQASMRFNGPGTASGRMGAAQPTTGTAPGRANGNGAGPATVVTNVAEFGEDLLSLAELQTRLAGIEFRQNIGAAKVGGAVIVTGAILALSALPVALIGVAELLVSLLEMNRGLAFLAVAVAAFVIAGIAIGIAMARLRSSDMGFPLSREEFTRNLNWLRTVLLYSGRSARRWGQ